MSEAEEWTEISRKSYLSVQPSYKDKYDAVVLVTEITDESGKPEHVYGRKYRVRIHTDRMYRDAAVEAGLADAFDALIAMHRLFDKRFEERLSKVQ